MNGNELSGEPAVWAALVSSAVQLVAAFFLPLSNDAVAGINAVVIAAAGIWMAVATRSADNGGSIKAALLGFASAGISLAVTFGWQVTPEKTAVLMSFVGMLLGVFIRQTSQPAGVKAYARR